MLIGVKVFVVEKVKLDDLPQWKEDHGIEKLDQANTTRKEDALSLRP